MRTELVRYMKAKDIMPQKDRVTTKSVLAFVKRNRIDALAGRQCGDGRSNETGMISRFGADGGYILGLLALNHKHNLGMSPEDIVDKVVEISVLKGGKAYFHTDDSGHGFGCGHLAQAANSDFASRYGVAAQDAERTIRHIQELKTQDPKERYIRVAVLKGEHKESFVIKNTGTKTTVKHNDGEEMAFVVDARRDEEYIDNDFFPELEKEIPALFDKKQEFKRILDEQMGVTAKILASEKKAYEVNADESDNISVIPMDDEDKEAA